ncbi:glutamine synthetase family protein [Shewanella litorisediminis]|uniref:Glutamine synthetase n=1 Tax=Shewanella litorisediminis TaxID=1173586 RepID=A0ABX7G6F4_9GAMM|nr:glutamine synthetase family protein [Shewanella litorisediminis]MCL2916923.1 glutamine synthetase family protein [Shewanella litorisediminis]QRH02914.1 glutamine synthetase [Shewanella litorisediminis]
MPFAKPQEAIDFLDKHPQVQHVEVFIIDPNGIPRGKLLHREEVLSMYRHGRPLPSTILGLTVQGDDVEDTGLVWEVGDADCMAFPIEGGLLMQPWRNQPTAQVHLAMHPEAGQPAAVADPRLVLARVIDSLQADGFYPVMAAELEFFLLDQRFDANGRPQPAMQCDGHRPTQTQVYGILELERLQPFLDDLYHACEVQGIPARTAISEYAPGQVEITLEHRFDALKAMDEAVRYKRLVKGVAAKHGMQACFMAKPFGELAGSGMHMHVSLADADGNNLFASDNPEGTPGLTQSIAGMMATLEDAQLLFCPNANSFRRFQSASYAPIAKTWGVNNRTVSFRVPGGPAPSRHVEHRICGADANPYLAAAAILAACHHGIRNQLSPGPAIVGNGYEGKHQTLPTDWLSALCNFERSEWMKTVLGEDFHRIYGRIKRAEYQQFMAEVGHQDWQWYLTHA